MRALANRFRALLRDRWALLLPAVAYLAIFPYLPELRSPNELSRLHQTRALVDSGSFEISRVLREVGWVGDLSCVAIARDATGRPLERRPCPEVRGDPRFREEHYYPSKAPLLSVAAVPAYAALRLIAGDRPVPEVPLLYLARLLCTVLPALLLLVPLRRYLRAHLQPPLADALTAAYALGTLAFSYAELFMSHQLTAVLLFACFFALWRLRRGEWTRDGYLVAGLLAGLAVACEYTAALGLLPLVGYGLATAPGGPRGKARAALLAFWGALPVVLALAAYHQIAFGDPLVSGYRYLNDAAYQGWHVGGFLGIRLPDPRAFALSFLSPLRGLLVLSPMLVLALPGLAPKYGSSARRPEWATSLAMLVLYAYFTSSFSYESWGWTTGPRHLTPLVPFLLLPIGLWLEAHAQSWGRRGVAAGLFAASIFATGAMTLLDYIPDSLTNALWQVALPFAVGGYLPHSPLSMLGVPNPWAALPALLAIAAALVGAVLGVLPPGMRGKALAAAVLTALIVEGLHASIRPRHPAALARDQGTRAFLEERYVPRPGEASPAFWPR